MFILYKLYTYITIWYLIYLCKIPIKINLLKKLQITDKKMIKRYMWSYIVYIDSNVIICV